jgi:hypothetical protein
MSSRRSLVLLGALVILALLGSVIAARAAAAAELDVIVDGRGSVSVSPSSPAGACLGERLPCTRYAYAPGQNVTLTATEDSRFVGWSDPRCPAALTCTLPMDADRQSVAARFQKHHVLVSVAGDGTVKTNGVECPPASNADALDCGEFDLLDHVTIEATPNDSQTTTTWGDVTLCEPPSSATTCTVIVDSLVWLQVGFGEAPPGIPPAINVAFRIIKRGNGSGTVTGGEVNCGNDCVDDKNFGDRETYVAAPDRGSTFSGWRGACSTAPTCSLAVGPVTAVIATFDASATSNPGTTPGSGPSGTHFVARMRRVAVSGHGRHRTIFIRLQVNAPATVRAVLSRGHRRVASRRWRVAAGTPLLRMRVPARARRGVYRLALTVRDHAGHTSHVARRVRLPR